MCVCVCVHVHTCILFGVCAPVHVHVILVYTHTGTAYTCMYTCMRVHVHVLYGDTNDIYMMANGMLTSRLGGCSASACAVLEASTWSVSISDS